jgi:hypothetical protein
MTIKFREDDFVYPLMVELTGCLCGEIERSGLPEPCQCSIIPGSEAVLDYCGECDPGGCGGQAWVRMAGAYPSQRFPSLDEGVVPCGSPMAYIIEIGIARCVDVGDASGIGGFTPPSVESQVAAVRVQTADMAAMRRALTCCLTENHDDLTYTLGQYVPIAGGGCNGGTWTVTVWSA